MAATICFYISAVIIALFSAVYLLDRGASFLFASFIGASMGAVSVYILAIFFIFIEKKIKSIRSSKK